MKNQILILLFIYLSIICHLVLSNTDADVNRVYINQFPVGSENLKLPPIMLFSLFMGKMKYEHLPFLLASMKWNPMVQFVLINVIEENSQDDAEIRSLSLKMNMTNFQIETLSFKQLTIRVKDKLGIDVPFNANWYYKMCDYKPTLGYLFSELITDKYKYWVSYY